MPTPAGHRDGKSRGLSKIRQSLAFHQRQDSGRRKLPGIQRFAARKSLFRKRPESPCAIAVVLVFLSVGGFPPLLGHFDFGTHDPRVGGEAGQTGKAEQVPCNLVRRMVIGEERVGGGISILLFQYWKVRR